MAAKTPTQRKLVRRATEGIEVALSWPKVGETLVLEVRDPRSDERYELEVPRSRALDAFRRPYAYLAAARARAAHDGLVAA